MKRLFLPICTLAFLVPSSAPAQEMPKQADSVSAATIPLVIKDPASAGFVQRPIQKQFAIGLRQLLPSVTITGDPAGYALRLDLGDSLLYGRVSVGQAYFDDQLTDYPETRYRVSSEIVHGKALISLKTFFTEDLRANANRWVDRGVFGYRLDLLKMANGRPVHAGIFDSRAHFRRSDSNLVPIVSITQPPMVGCVVSDHPEWVVMTFTADRRSEGLVEVERVGIFGSGVLAERHEIAVKGLRPAEKYRYRAIAIAGRDTAMTPWLSFRSAPKKGTGSFLFAYAGDGRAATGGGEYEYVGVNRAVGSQIARQVFRQKAAFLLFGGDLIAGYTNSPDEFRMELMAFRETYGSLLAAAPLYSAIGNHEALLHFYADGSRRGFGMDRWPYAAQSAEAIFAAEFLQPVNGPSNEAGRPPYAESVFSFHYGPVKLIVLNNNYWYTAHNRIEQFGGSPEGYILPEQMEWLRNEMAAAEKDPTVAHIVLMAQEPVFPAGGHVADAMWHGGNNNRRAYQFDGTKTVPLGPGMIDLRNALWTIVSGSRKVAVMLGSDEHNYHRLLIDRKTPVGIPSQDDRNGNGILDDGVYSPNPAFRYPTWFVISGGAGAPYYTSEPAPWSGASKMFTPQANFILFRGDAKKIGMEVYAPNGQLLDRVEDLKGGRR